jgi:hypothetical protein
MGKGNNWSNDILGLLFNGTAVSGIAINATSAPLTTIYVSLHTANPGASGAQNTSEAAYTNYSRVGLARTSGAWSLSGQTISPVSNISFPAATGGSETETFFGIGTAASGTGTLLYSGTVTANIVVTSGVTPVLTTASTITES